MLRQYDRIDPVELQSLKDELERLKSQGSQVETAEVEKYKKEVGFCDVHEDNTTDFLLLIG